MWENILTALNDALRFKDLQIEMDERDKEEGAKKLAEATRVNEQLRENIKALEERLYQTEQQLAQFLPARDERDEGRDC